MLKRLTALCLAYMLCLAGACGAQAEITRTLRRGARGSEVVELQEMLRELGLYTIAVDGIYGKGTVSSVKTFQRISGLKADGVAGPMTLGALYQRIGDETAAPATPTPTPSALPQPTASPTAAPAYPTLVSGARGSQVKALQTALKAKGYYSKGIDGIYGKGTAAAVEAFQRAAGLPATGEADSLTQQTLYSSEAPAQTPAPTPASSLRLGDSGEAVVQLKTRLWYLGYYAGSLTGDFDAETKAAVQAFQRAQSLTRDGIAGKKTLAALDAAWLAAKQTDADLPDEAAALLNAIRVQSGAVCGTLVLSKNGKTFLTRSFGYVNENTCFRIASVTKWVTAIGLMTLYDQGRLDLDADISNYLPFDVRNPAWPGTPITARMLLSHTSSLSPDADTYHPTWSRIGVNGYDPIFDESVRPGTKYAYADYNGALFGCLIEAITGESVQNYMDRAVFKPLGLTAAYSPKLLPAGTSTADLLTTKGKVAISVTADEKRAFNNKADPVANNGYTVGRLFINTPSLTRLAQMMLAGGELDGVRVLNEETVALMEADQPGLAESRYGLSTVRLTQFPRGTWYGHQGRYSGLTSNVYYQRETGITLALVMNGYDFTLEDNVVLPAVTLLRNMETLEALCTEGA